MSENAKACPFCGCLELEPFGGEDDPDHWIACLNCSAQGPVATIGCRDPEEEAFDLSAEAVELWNKRALEPGSLTDSRVLGLHMAQWILAHPSGMRDHACARCVPGGELVQPGFVCAQHVAADLVAASEKSEAWERMKG